MRKVLVFAIAASLLLVARFAAAQVNSQPAQTPAPKRSNAPQKRPTGGEEVGPEDVIRVNTTLVTSPVLVIGRDGKFVPSLRREDFHVFEEGVEKNIAYFAPVDKPFTVALLIDTSRSLLFDLRDLQDAAISFVDKMRPNDRALIVSFDDRIEVPAEATSDRDVLRKAIRGLRLGGNTRLYDAVDFVVKERMNQIVGRAAIILFTDGVDTASRNATYESNLRAIEKSEALIYPIQFSTYAYMKRISARTRRAPPEGSGFSAMDYMRADAYLHQVAEETSVPLYPASDISDLESAVGSIVEELHNEYSLGYYPGTLAQAGELRRIEVRVNRPQLFVRARTGYVLDQSGRVAQAPRSVEAAVAVPAEIGSLPVYRSSSVDRLPTGAHWICKEPNVPSDFAVVRDGFDANCAKSTRPNDKTNAWFIRKPGASEILCKGFFMWNGREMEGTPIPTGYAVVGQLSSPACARSNDPKRPANAWSVKIPGHSETVCKGFLIPRGYVVAGEVASPACPAKTGAKNAWLITQKPYVETRRFWVEEP